MNDLSTVEKRFLTARGEAREGRDPTCAEETLRMLIDVAKASGAKRYLEIGAAEGFTAITMAWETGVEVTAIEKDAERAQHARENIDGFDLLCDGRIRLIEGDAGEILPMLGGGFDVIFLDGPKAQYKKYFPDCKRLLNVGGYLFSDDILLYGWVRGEPPKKRRMLVEHIREYLTILNSDTDFQTEIYEYGEGLAVSKRIR